MPRRPPDRTYQPRGMSGVLEAVERLGLALRMELFRRALHAFLEQEGETEVAALFLARE